MIWCTIHVRRARTGKIQNNPLVYRFYYVLPPRRRHVRPKRVRRCTCTRTLYVILLLCIYNMMDLHVWRIRRNFYPPFGGLPLAARIMAYLLCTILCSVSNFCGEHTAVVTRYAARSVASSNTQRRVPLRRTGTQREYVRVPPPPRARS